MHYRPDPMMQQGFNQPASVSGSRRLISLVGFYRAGVAGVGLMIALGIAQVTFPTAIKPGTIIGDFYGSIVAAEQNATRESTARNAEATADAQARAEARKAEQVIAAENAQQLRSLTLTPQIMGSWVAQGMCMWGAMTGDTAKQQACAVVPPLNDAIVAQQGSAIDQLGTARMWGRSPSPAPVQAADGPPLNRGEIGAIVRLERSLSASAVTQARANLAPGNTGQRFYLERLRAMAGEPTPADAADTSAPVMHPLQAAPSGQYVPHAVPNFGR